MNILQVMNIYQKDCMKPYKIFQMNMSILYCKPEIRYITEKDTILREEIKTLKDDNRKMADFILSNFTPEQIKELNDKNRRLKINEKIHKGMDVKQLPESRTVQVRKKTESNQ